MRNIFWLLLFFYTALPSHSRLKRCDLLFHVAAGDNEITTVTGGSIDHVAIVINHDSVIEAIGTGVVVTPLDSLFARDGFWVQARVTTAVAHGKTLARARSFVGCAYDSLFLAGNDAIYCSELVQLSFVNSRDSLIFTPVPMSFHDSEGHITDYWRAFYARHGMTVPEGQPGTNPQELSRRANVRIIKILRRERSHR